MAAIRNLCQRTLLLDCGRLVLDTNTEQVVAEYLDQNIIQNAIATAKDFKGKIEGVIKRDKPSIRFREIALIDEQNMPRNAFQSDEEIGVSVSYECLTVVNDLRIIVEVVDEENKPILTSLNTDDAADSGNFYRREPGIYTSSCKIPPNTFGGKRFYISVRLSHRKVEHLILNKILSFDVTFKGYNLVHEGFKNSFLRPKLSWQTLRLNEEEVNIVGR